MWKWIKCKFVGSLCEWRTTHTERYEREAYGIYVNTLPPTVRCETHTQKCVTCGKIRSIEVQLRY